MVEFAVILPVFCGLILGLASGGMAFFGKLQLTTAAQEGVRALYVGGGADAGDAKAAALNASPGASGDPDVPTVTVGGSPVANGWSCDDHPGVLFKVTHSRDGVEINWLIATTTVDLEGGGAARCQ